MLQHGRVENIAAAVIGAGQAGLSVSHHLRALSVEHTVFERGRAAESWRSQRWDSFTLVTPNWMTRLPGYAAAPGSATRFLPRDEVVGALAQLAAGSPIREHTAVSSVEAVDGGYLLTGEFQPVLARSVVVAGGGQRRPRIPAESRQVPRGVAQLHSSGYRSATQLPPGAVLVVGSGQSGAQIAEELAAAGRDVLLATSRVARVPRRYRGRDIHEWSVELGLYDQRVDRMDERSRLHDAHPTLSGGRGGHTLALQQLARDGVRLLGRLVDVEGDKLRFASNLAENIRFADQQAARVRGQIDTYIASTGTTASPADPDPAERPGRVAAESPPALDRRAEHISSIIWCTGFGPDTDWLDVPVLDADGRPLHTRGITAFPGLYVVGHPWLSTRSSGILYGVDEDAVRIAQHAAAYLATAAGTETGEPINASALRTL